LSGVHAIGPKSPYNTPTLHMPLTEIIASAFQFKWTSFHLKVGVV